MSLANLMRQSAADVMTAYPHTIGPDAPLAQAAELMHKHHVRHLPVVDATASIVGMLSDRDVRTAHGSPQQRVEDVMSYPAIVVPFDTSLVEIAKRLVSGRVGALPVTDKFGAVIGIVSYIDALRSVASR